MQRRPHISAPFRPRRDEQEDRAADPITPPLPATSQPVLTALPHLAAVKPAKDRPGTTALEATRGSRMQPHHAARSLTQENKPARGSTAGAAYVERLQPHREPLCEKPVAEGLAGAASSRPTKGLRCAPAETAFGERAVPVGKSQAGSALETPPQLQPDEKTGWKASQAARARGAIARHSAFEESPLPAVSNPTAEAAPADQAAARAAAPSAGNQAANKLAATATVVIPPVQVFRAKIPSQRAEQAPLAASQAEPGRRTQPDAGASADVAGSSLSARTAAWREFAALSTKPRSTSLESKSYRSGAAFCALAARDLATRRAGDHEGGSPVKRRGASSSPVRSRRAAPISAVASARGLPSPAGEAKRLTAARRQVCIWLLAWARILSHL